MSSDAGIGFRFKEFFSVEKGALLKIAILILVLYYFAWHVFGLGDYIRKQVFGTPHETAVIALQNEERIEDFEDYNAGLGVNIKGLVIYKTFVKKYAVAGTFVAHGKNKEFLEYSKLNLDKEDKKVYMQVSPDNVTVILGNARSTLKVCDFDQPTNSYVKCPKDFKDEMAYINNYHIIPANKTVAMGVNSLPKRAEKEIYMEGFLLDWDFVNNDGELRFKTALKSGELIPHNLETEVKLRKNFQLYLTRLVYDGYEFK